MNFLQLRVMRLPRLSQPEMYKEDFELKLEQMIANYDFYIKKMDQYSLNAETMSEEYLFLFENLFDSRSIKNQKITIRGRLFLLNQLKKKYFRIFKLFIKKLISQ